MQSSDDFHEVDLSLKQPTGARGSKKRAVLVGAGAFLLFGSWALFANHAHPTPVMVRAGLAQGTLSFVSTTFSVLLLEYLYGLGRTRAKSFLLAAFGTPVIILLAMTSVHLVAGTPNVATTLLPSCISGFIFSTTYTLGLRRALASRA